MYCEECGQPLNIQSASCSSCGAIIKPETVVYRDISPVPPNTIPVGIVGAVAATKIKLPIMLYILAAVTVLSLVVLFL